MLVVDLPRDPNALEDGAILLGQEFDIVVRQAEEDKTETAVPALVKGRLDDTVNGRLVEPAGEHLHRITDVDDLQNGQVRMNSLAWAWNVEQ